MAQNQSVVPKFDISQVKTDQIQVIERYGSTLKLTFNIKQIEVK